MSDNKKIPLRELSTPVVERCAAALQTEWDDLDRGYPGGKYPAIRFATHLAASAALKALEDGMVLGIREDGK